MTSSAIQVQAVNKIFQVWHHPSDILREILTGRKRSSEFRALSDIAFAVEPGSVVGLMGRNGAGKSTLLRIIAGTLDATSGSVAVKGRISAILELGTGFHPDYSGRENVFLGGMCLGLSRAEIKQRFDEIVAFAELSEFIDQPFRTYSSGMQARLTFAVATSVDPDILIVDEALSVGDARFQLKSFDRIRDFKRRGKSILLVSHDANQIATFCDHAILLERGAIVAQGEPVKIGNIYHEMLFGPKEMGISPLPVLAAIATTRADADGTSGDSLTSQALDGSAPDNALPTPSDTDGAAKNVEDAAIFKLTAEDEASPDADSEILSATSESRATSASEREHRYGDGKAIISRFEIRTPSGKPTITLKSLAQYDLVCEIEAVDDVKDLCFGFLVRNTRGLDLFGWDMQMGGCQPIDGLRAGERMELKLRFTNNFAAGTYFVTLALARWDKHKHDLRFDVMEVFVEPTPKTYTASVVNLTPQTPSVRLMNSTADKREMIG